MSRVSNALNMYFLLQVRGLMKAQELARELEVTPRMIKEYKKDLELAGIYIGSQLGRYGGYYLENKRKLDGINLTDDEISALKMAKETIKSGKYHYSVKFEIIISKILSSYENLETTTHYHNKTSSEADEIVKKEKAAWVDINLAINKNKKIAIEYKSLKKQGMEIKQRVVSPYGIFDYKGATYFYGFCELVQDIRFFKLSRIIQHNILPEKFKIKLEFDFDEVLSRSFGIFNDQLINLKLKIKYPMSEIVKEKQICKHQKITTINDKEIIFEAELNGYPEIKGWILSMGSHVEVIEPAQLKEDVRKEAEKILEIYK